MVFRLLGDMHDKLSSGGEKCGKIMFMALCKHQLNQRREKKVKRKKDPKSLRLSL